MDGLTTEPNSSWQNISEHSIGNLGVMVQRNMKEFNAPMNQCHWHMKWCKDVHNVLAMEKLKLRTPKDMLTGDTPEMSMLKYHMWEKYVISIQLLKNQRIR